LSSGSSVIYTIGSCSFGCALGVAGFGFSLATGVGIMMIGDLSRGVTIGDAPEFRLLDTVVVILNALLSRRGSYSSGSSSSVTIGSKRFRCLKSTFSRSCNDLLGLSSSSPLSLFSFLLFFPDLSFFFLSFLSFLSFFSLSGDPLLF
jgi:hypothetical protein